MTLLLREVARFLAEVAVWIGVELVIAGAWTLLIARSNRSAMLQVAGFGFMAAVVCASIAVRFDLPGASSPLIGGRPLPLAWSVAGAGIGVALAARSSGRDAS